MHSSLSALIVVLSEMNSARGIVKLISKPVRSLRCITTAVMSTAEISECRQKCLQGHFEMESLVQLAGVTSNCRPLPDWIPDYTGPVECVQMGGGKGLGLVATKAIQPGHLVVASRAFEVVFSHDCRSFVPIFDWNPEGLGEMVKSILMAKVIDKVNSSDAHLQDLYKLHPRPDQPESQVDLDRIGSIINFNTFGNADEPLVESNSAFVRLFDLHGGGLWLLPSMLNHSCVRNTSAIFLGDFIFIRAAKLIAAGQEVTISYCPVNTQNESERRKNLEKFGFTCDCPLCRHDRKVKVDWPMDLYESRARLYGDFNRLARRRHPDLSDLHAVVTEFQQNCAFKLRFDHYLTNMLETLGVLQLRKRQTASTLDSAINYFTQAHTNRCGSDQTAPEIASTNDYISDTISLQYFHNLLTLARVNHVKGDREGLSRWGRTAQEYLQRNCGFTRLSLIDPVYKSVEAELN